MENLILIVSTAAVMGFGFFLVKRLDRFLASNAAAIQNGTAADCNSLRIAFANPLVAGALSGTFERLSKSHCGLAFDLYAADAAALKRALRDDQIDIAVLSQPPEMAGLPECGVVSMQLKPDSLRASQFNLPIHPLSGSAAQQYVVWKKPVFNQSVCELVKLLETDSQP